MATSLTAQISGGTQPSAPSFSGLRRICPKLDAAVSFSHQSFLNRVNSSIRLVSSSSHRSPRGVVAMAGSGKFFVGGNWKCNGTKDSIAKLVSDLNSATLEADVDVVVSPPFVYIDQVKSSLTDRIEISGQNSWVGKGGAFTAWNSSKTSAASGSFLGILKGDMSSEKRMRSFIGKKAAYALSEGLGVIACIGEKLEEREAGKTFDVCFEQMKAFADAVPSWDNVVVAYEPVWAIGTGKVASPQQAQEVHVAVRDWLKKNVSEEVASKTRIIYGGSVNGGNCAELAKQEDIDGFLVGGASLKGPEFATIVNSVTSKKVAA
ncbi:hypothetical protein EUTSA_v10000249mg [Eutrema salsugineum]|uniref:Triosephosphate isomerase n=1 Tax=Eutrema salsugineum TaxID=72664 RepID=V4M1F7_EUTSA|nr:hypothetical protein EUTSA_v10000249mg [Eutrema salsugineum]